MILRTHMVEEKNLSWNLHIHVLACMLPLPGLLINTRNNKKKIVGAGELAQQLKALAVLPGDQFSPPTRQLTQSVTLVPGGILHPQTGVHASKISMHIKYK